MSTTNLLTLPDEILRIIVQHVSQEDWDDWNDWFTGNKNKSDTVALALVCHRLHTISRNLLVRNLNWSVHAPFDGALSRLELLCRTLDESPGLRCSIHRVSVYWSTNDFLEVRILSAVDALLKHLALSNVVDLQLISYCAMSKHPLPAIFDCDSGSFSNLRNLRYSNVSRLQGDAMYADDVLKLCRFPKLESVEFVFAIKAPRSDAKVETGDYSVTELIQYRDALDPEAATYLLARLPRLQKLHIWAFGRDGISKRHHRRGHPNMHCAGVAYPTALSPAAIGETLQATCSALTDLDICGPGVRWRGHDGTMINLVALNQMRHLRIDARLLFGDAKVAVECPWVNELGTYLPPSLENLRIMFADHPGILQSYQAQLDTALMLEENYQMIWPMPDTIQCKNMLGWVQMLVRSTKTRLTRLTSIELAEWGFFNTQVAWVSIPWTVPDDLACEWMDDGVSVGIEVRCPEGYAIASAEGNVIE